MDQSSRIKTIRERLGWTQSRMAEYLGLNRSRVSHMENGQPPTGPVGKLLDQLETSVQAASDPPGSSHAEFTLHPSTEVAP